MHGAFRTLLTACTLALVGMAAPQSAPAPQPAASVLIDPPSFDLGRVPPGASISRTFQVRNTGQTPVKVISSFPSCKCTTLTDLAGKVIPPGGSLELAASLDAPRAPGPKDAKVFVTVEGAPKPLIAKLEGVVTLPVQPSPPYVDALKGVRKGAIEFASTDGKAFRVLSVDGSSPQFADFDPAKDEPRSHYLVRWDLGMVPDGKMRQWMVVETDRDDCPLVPLRIRNEWTGSRFDPQVDTRGSFLPESVVVMGRLKPGEGRDLEVELEGSAPKGKLQIQHWDEVKRVLSQDDALHAQLIEVKRRGERAVVRFRCTLGLNARGFVYAPVAIETGSGTARCFVTAVAKP